MLFFFKNIICQLHYVFFFVCLMFQRNFVASDVSVEDDILVGICSFAVFNRKDSNVKVEKKSEDEIW